MDEIRCYTCSAHHTEMFQGSAALQMRRHLEGLMGSILKRPGSRKGNDIMAPDQLIKLALLGFVTSLASGSYHH